MTDEGELLRVKSNPPIGAILTWNSNFKVLAPIHPHSFPINRRPPSLQGIANSLLRRASIHLWIFSQTKWVLTKLEVKLYPILNSSDPLKLIIITTQVQQFFNWSFVATLGPLVVMPQSHKQSHCSSYAAPTGLLLAATKGYQSKGTLQPIQAIQVVPLRPYKLPFLHSLATFFCNILKSIL